MVHSRDSVAQGNRLIHDAILNHRYMTSLDTFFPSSLATRHSILYTLVSFPSSLICHLTLITF
jgi:hypothetical protein